jgi:hypothetical protein
MRATGKTRGRRSVALLAAAVLGVVAAGCGGGDFQDNPRPPVRLDLTGVIQDTKLTLSPSAVGAGPILITISNQTKDAHTVTLEGEPTNGNRVLERIGPINPLDTATLQKTLAPGSYQVRAGSAAAVPREIAPATLKIGPERRDSNGDLLQP